MHHSPYYMPDIRDGGPDSLHERHFYRSIEGQQRLPARQQIRTNWYAASDHYLLTRMHIRQGAVIQDAYGLVGRQPTAKDMESLIVFHQQIQNEKGIRVEGKT